MVAGGGWKGTRWICASGSWWRMERDTLDMCQWWLVEDGKGHVGYVPVVAGGGWKGTRGICASGSWWRMERDTLDMCQWWLVEDGKGQVGYVPVAYLMIIIDEEESDTTRKEVHERGTDVTKIGGEMGQDGERRNIYMVAVIDGIKRNSNIYVGDSTVRKTDCTLNKDEDIVVCFPGARIEHVAERVQRIMGRGHGGTILVHIGTNNADK